MLAVSARWSLRPVGGAGRGGLRFSYQTFGPQVPASARQSSASGKPCEASVPVRQTARRSDGPARPWTSPQIWRTESACSCSSGTSPPLRLYAAQTPCGPIWHEPRSLISAKWIPPSRRGNAGRDPNLVEFHDSIRNAERQIKQIDGKLVTLVGELLATTLQQR